MSSTAEISNRILEIVERSPEKRVLGGRLAGILREELGFDPEIHGKLKDFIAANVQTVVRVEPAGKDWYYGYPSSQPEEIPRPPATTGVPAPEISRLSRAVDGPVWKTFASPNTKYRLLGNQQTGMLMIVPPGQALPGPPWVIVPSCASATHVEIARAFLEELGNPTKRSILQGVVDQAGSGPSSNFYQTVTALGLAQAWNRFRRERILRHMAATLGSLGIQFQGVVNGPGDGGYHVDGGIQRPHVPAGGSSFDGINIRRVAIAAIERMSETEIRSLNLPLGYIIDAITSR